MGSLPEFLVKCLCAVFFSELQTCFHDQMQSIKVMLVAAIKIASLKKNLSKLQGVGLFQKWQGKVAHLAILIKRGRKKRPNNREFLVFNADCQLFTAGSRALDIQRFCVNGLCAFYPKVTEMLCTHYIFLKFSKTLPNNST